MAEQTAAGLRALVDAYRPALLQPTTNYVNGQIALSVGEHSGIPVVYEVRGFLEETWRSAMGESITDSERYQRTKAIETEIMRRAAGVVTLSETMRADILARGGVDPDKVVVIPNAVDVDRFHPGPRDDAARELARHRARRGGRRLHLEPDPVRGHRLPARGRQPAARRRAGGSAVLVVGDGKERERLEAIVAADPLLGRRRGHPDRPRAARRHRGLLPAHRRVRRAPHQRPGLAPGHAAQAVRGDGHGAAHRRQRRAGARRRSSATGETGPDLRGRGRGGARGRRRPSCSTTRRNATALGRAARAWVSEHRTWAQNGQRYLELYRRLGVA